MGGNTEIDLAALRAVADRVKEAAESIDEMRWPTMPADELKGSAVGNVPAPDLIAAKLADVVANMRGWAVAARMSADAFERADRSSADRFHR
jgi:NADPH-dependent curcumin reductase CurA